MNVFQSFSSLARRVSNLLFIISFLNSRFTRITEGHFNCSIYNTYCKRKDFLLINVKLTLNGEFRGAPKNIFFGRPSISRGLFWF
jgi:hypothetical protein